MLYIAENLHRLSDDALVSVGTAAVSALKQNANSYDEADYVLREALFSFYIKQEMFSDAGQVLAGLNLDSNQKTYTNEEKVDIYIRCAEAFLEDGEGNEAEIFLNKASPMMHSVSEWSLQLRFSVTLARVLDFNRKFIDAALRYYDLSTTQNRQVVQSDLLELYGKAITCAVLGRAGPQRTRILAVLHKDERYEQLDRTESLTSHGAILSKMHNNEIVRPEEMSAFEKYLMPHQLATTADGFTLPEKAVIEHNVLAARRVFRNMYFTALAQLLRLDVSMAQKVASKMISEGRLKAWMDETEGLLYFDNGEGTEFQEWNESIRDTCDELTYCVDKIQSQGLGVDIA